MTWVIVAGALVIFMQAGFACVEMGFSRSKNVGTVVAKVLLNFSVVDRGLVAVRLRAGLRRRRRCSRATPASPSRPPGTRSAGQPDRRTRMTGNVAGFAFFQLVFCAVSLAIVWGTTLERIRFIAYPIYAAVFAGLIYPLVAHWIFGGGLLGHLGERHAGLRRLDGGAPDGRHGRPGRAAAAGAAPRRSTAPDGRARARSPATRCRCSASAC